MNIIGWMALFGVTSFACLITYFMVRVSLAYAGKIDGQVWAMAAVTVVMVYIVYTTYPTMPMVAS